MENFVLIKKSRRGYGYHMRDKVIPDWPKPKQAKKRKEEAVNIRT